MNERLIHDQRKKGRLFLTIVLALLITLGASGGGRAQPVEQQLPGSVPSMLNYQGVVKIGGVAYNGSGYFKFAIVDSTTGNGTLNYWANDGTASGEPGTAVSLAVEQGLFNVLLGDTSLAGMTRAINEDTFASVATYLRVWFSQSGTAGTFTGLEPNQRIASVAYAFHALYAKNGANGATGATGPQGAQGPAGPQGATGATGATGPRGPSGPSGPQGEAGAAGETGAQGPQGVAGAAGDQGPAGPSGPSGPQGPQGVAGAAGDQGPAGPSGPSGPQGEAGAVGATGDQGPAGPSGPSGPQGAEGATGATGPSGPTGPSGWLLTGNTGTTPGTDYLGSSDNVALELKVHGERALRLEPFTGSPNLIGGSAGNSVTPGAVGATVAGGGNAVNTNRVTDDYGFVGGGENNQAGDSAGTTTDASYAVVSGGSSNTASSIYSSVGGGYDNTASGSDSSVGGGISNIASNFASTVGGGYDNTASGIDSTVGGGFRNTASGVNSTVGGGDSNTASGSDSTVGGGYDNTASGKESTVAGGRNTSAAGDDSFAAGYHANIDSSHNGTFLFADDSSNFDFSSSAAREFAARATGGVRFVLGIDGSGNPTWTCSVGNGGTWSCASDRNLKENITPVDGRQTLARLAEMPIAYWNAKGTDPTVRHLGPMAQDFRAAFGLGQDDKSISTIDLDGVALASIQGLNAELKDRDQHIQALQADIKALHADNKALQADNKALHADNTVLEQRLAAVELHQSLGAAGGLPSAWLMVVIGLAMLCLLLASLALGLAQRRGGVR